MVEVLILFLLIIINGLLVMSEIALVSARKARLESLANKGDEKARVALALAEKPEKFLSTAQIFITLIAILTGVYSGEKFSGHIQPFVEPWCSKYLILKRLPTALLLKKRSRL
ncbi:MAG: CNNM domain-containing protein [Sphingobacteriales bacterium]|nr:CNNM domain-containing protein [Sphingobacteriales bacterium]